MRPSTRTSAKKQSGPFLHIALIALAAALSGSHVERYLSENHRYLANSYQGLAVIQAAHLHSLRILDKLQEIKQLAQNASTVFTAKTNSARHNRNLAI